MSSSAGTVRLDPADFDALVDAARNPFAGGAPEAKAALANDWVHGMMRVILDPAAEMRLVVAGPTTRVNHCGWLGDDVLVLLLGVRPELLQLMKTDPAFLTATLVRLTRMQPRHLPDRAPVEFPADRLDQLITHDPRMRALALADADANFAWRLDLTTDGGKRTLTAVDGDLGLRLAYPEDGQLVPVTNTFAYRVLSTVLTRPDSGGALPGQFVGV